MEYQKTARTVQPHEVVMELGQWLDVKNFMTRSGVSHSDIVEATPKTLYDDPGDPDTTVIKFCVSDKVLSYMAQKMQTDTAILRSCIETGKSVAGINMWLTPV